jgi:hypothetical protein
MKTQTSLIAAAIAASSLTLALNAFGATTSDVPAAHMQGKVTYLSGGIGLTEANAIKHVAGNYPLELEFLARSKPKDEYLADVRVQIRDARDKLVLDTTSAGPFLLAQIPAGQYTISANHDGQIEHRKIEIAAKEHRRVVFEWRS